MQHWVIVTSLREQETHGKGTEVSVGKVLVSNVDQVSQVSLELCEGCV